MKWFGSGAVPARIGTALDPEDKKTRTIDGYRGASSEVPAEEPQEDTKGTTS